MAYTQILYQLVFTTKRRQPTLNSPNRIALYKYWFNLLKNKKCYPYIVNGIDNHTHFLFSLHPSISLSNLVKDIKLSGTHIIKKEGLFNHFEGWQSSYSAFTYDLSRKEILFNYIKNQEKHHKKQTYLDEIKSLYKKHNISYKEEYL